MGKDVLLIRHLAGGDPSPPGPISIVNVIVGDTTGRMPLKRDQEWPRTRGIFRE